MSGDTHPEELLPDYALGCLDADEAVLVAEHLAECSACRAEFRAFQKVANELALTAGAVAPPAEIRRRLMHRVQALRPTRVSQPLSSRWTFLGRVMPVWGLASLLMILALAVVNLLLWQRVNRLEVATGPGGMRAIPVSGTSVMPNASGFIIVSADGRNGALVVDRLPPLEPERQYQLWLIRDGQRTSGAVFSTNEDGYGGVRISAPESLLNYSAVGVTIEPAGGSPSPTGDKVLGGPLFNP